MVSIEYLNIIQDTLIMVSEKFKAFISDISEQARVPSPNVVDEWVHISKNNVTLSKNKNRIQDISATDYDYALPGSSLWWAQTEFILTSISLFSLFMESTRIYVSTFKSRFLLNTGAIYSKLMGKMDGSHEDSSSDFYLLHLANSTLNSSSLYEFYRNLESSSDFKLDSGLLQRNQIPQTFETFETNASRTDSIIPNINFTYKLADFLFPNFMYISTHRIYPEFQLMLFGLLFWIQLGNIEKIPDLNQWHMKSPSNSNLYSSSAGSRADGRTQEELEQSKIKVPQFSLSPSLNIRAVGEQIMYLPMILEQIEGKNLDIFSNSDYHVSSVAYTTELEGEEYQYGIDNLGQHQFMKSGKDVLSFPLLFLLDSNNLPSGSLIDSSLDKQMASFTTSKEWFFALADSTMNQFIKNTDLIERPFSEIGKKQLSTDINYLGSIFSTMDIPLNSKFVNLQETYKQFS
ncbi:hypothetical protein AYI68_g2331 [Smittium mucronatum]|uniref:Conserved oligomeric Golgi complex subunit 7 n=1 Tax=Smittium mucronatum TaxID=133383 RepID=A0A1R0H305_9FUNG|nr:hypothetical protein AYI68_g2331 [Smittium mucronatum]